MSILSLLVVLVIIGVGLYLVRLIPMDPTVQKIITVVAILLIVLWLADAFLGLGTVHIGRLR